MAEKHATTRSLPSTGPELEADLGVVRPAHRHHLGQPLRRHAHEARALVRLVERLGDPLPRHVRVHADEAGREDPARQRRAHRHEVEVEPGRSLLP